jgi:ABC-type Mn2+/Zn2+ transport system permease subunit
MLSYYIGSASGAMIVLVNAVLFVCCFIFSLFKKQ